MLLLLLSTTLAMYSLALHYTPSACDTPFPPPSFTPHRSIAIMHMLRPVDHTGEQGTGATEQDVAGAMEGGPAGSGVGDKTLTSRASRLSPLGREGRAP